MLHRHDLHRVRLLLNSNAKGGARLGTGLRPAAAGDLAAILELLSASGLPLEGVGDSLVDFVVADVGGRVLGVGGLEIVGPHALLRSVAVAEDTRGAGLGLAITARLLASARERQLESIWLLTETAPQFFERFGFRRVDRSIAPPGLAATAEFKHCCPASAVAMARRAQPLAVLVLCTANSARSQLGEALLRHRGGDLVRVASAGTSPGSGPHPSAVAELRRRGIDWAGKGSKALDQVGDDWELVITVCDGARDSCPTLPGHAATHWGLPDPADAADLAAAFSATATALAERIDALLNLPWGVMSAEEIAVAATAIGRKL